MRWTRVIFYAPASSRTLTLCPALPFTHAWLYIISTLVYCCFTVVPASQCCSWYYYCQNECVRTYSGYFLSQNLFICYFIKCICQLADYSFIQYSLTQLRKQIEDEIMSFSLNISSNLLWQLTSESYDIFCQYCFKKFVKKNKPFSKHIYEKHIRPS